MQRDALHLRGGSAGFGWRSGGVRRRAAGANIADDAAGVAGDDRIRGDVARHHRTGANHGSRANHQAWKYRGVGTDRSTLLYENSRQPGLMISAAREGIIGESGIGADE